MSLIVRPQHKQSISSPVYSHKLIDKQIEKRHDGGGRQETSLFLLSKLRITNHCRLAAVVNEVVQFGENYLRHFLGEVPSIICGRIFFLKF